MCLSKCMQIHWHPFVITAKALQYFRACVVDVQLAVELQSGHAARQGSRGDLLNPIEFASSFLQLLLMSLWHLSTEIRNTCFSVAWLAKLKRRSCPCLVLKVSHLTGRTCLQASEQSIREQEEIQKGTSVGVGPITAYPPGWLLIAFCLSPFLHEQYGAGPAKAQFLLHQGCKNEQGIVCIQLSWLAAALQA